jgi:hypothetical protein
MGGKLQFEEFEQFEWFEPIKSFCSRRLTCPKGFSR